MRIKALLMMAIAYFVRSIFYLKEKKNYDITFFYSFPLHDEIHLLDCMFFNTFCIHLSTLKRKRTL
jgi:hypothetical protein